MQRCSRRTVLFQLHFIFPAETWSQPNNYSYPILVTADDGLKPHINVTQLINQLLSRNTLKSYRTAWNTYCRFLASCPRAMTGDIKHDLAFTLYCHMHLALSHNTIRLYLAGIQHFLSFTEPRQSIFIRSPHSQIHPTRHPETAACSQLQTLAHHKCYL